MKLTHLLRGLLASVFLAATLPHAALAALVTEVPDAGQTLGAAQDATVVPLTGINGTLSAEPSAGPDFVDMYRIFIPGGGGRIFANTGPGTDPALVADPVLFLFDALGMGVAMDDETGGFGQASLTTGILNGGFYYLAIAFAGLEPLDAGGNPIFDAFGGGGLLSVLGLDSWFGTPFAIDPSVEGRYSITTSVVPLPGTLLLVVLGLAALRAARKSDSRRA
ncbi:MAG: hypothetical protein ACKVQR_06750 [Aquabacterium sp.]